MLVISVMVLDGKQETEDESRVEYMTHADVSFYKAHGVAYATWLGIDGRYVHVPATQLVSIVRTNG